MSKILASIINLLAAFIVAFSILLATWFFSYPGRMYSCEMGLGHYTEMQPKLARRYCLKNVEV